MSIVATKVSVLCKNLQEKGRKKTTEKRKCLLARSLILRRPRGQCKKLTNKHKTEQELVTGISLRWTLQHFEKFLPEWDREERSNTF